MATRKLRPRQPDFVSSPVRNSKIRKQAQFLKFQKRLSQLCAGACRCATSQYFLTENILPVKSSW